MDPTGIASYTVACILCGIKKYSAIVFYNLIDV